MKATSESCAAPRPPGATAFERAIAERATAYARAWLKAHGLRGEDLARTVERVEAELVEIVVAQRVDLVLMTLADDGLAILASEDERDLENFVAATAADCRGQFGLNLPAIAVEVRRVAEGCHVRH